MWGMPGAPRRWTASASTAAGPGGLCGHGAAGGDAELSELWAVPCLRGSSTPSQASEERSECAWLCAAVRFHTRRCMGNWREAAAAETPGVRVAAARSCRRRGYETLLAEPGRPPAHCECPSQYPSHRKAMPYDAAGLHSGPVPEGATGDVRQGLSFRSGPRSPPASSSCPVAHRARFCSHAPAAHQPMCVAGRLRRRHFPVRGIIAAFPVNHFNKRRRVHS